MSPSKRRNSKPSKAASPPANPLPGADQLLELAQLAGANQFMSQQAFEALTKITSSQTGGIEVQSDVAQDPFAAGKQEKGGKRGAKSDRVQSRTQVFISYSHKDRKWLEKLETHLKPFGMRHKLDMWVDTNIEPGAKWRKEIKKALARAKVAVLLVSPDFLASDFIDKNELKVILAAEKKGGLTILWIPIRPSAYNQTQIRHYKAVFEPTRPLSRLTASQQDNALVKICEAIYKAAK
jgi:hypothetical protein